MVAARSLAIMFTDIKGFTERTHASSRDDLVTLLDTHENLVVPIARSRAGTLIKGIGDAFLFTFPSATDAVIAGVEILGALRAHNAGVPRADALELRIGVNVGEVTVVKHDVYGDAVNVASRVESITRPMQLGLTEAVYLMINRDEVAAVVRTHEMRFFNVGHVNLKGIKRPVRVFRIGHRKTAKQRPLSRARLAHPPAWWLPAWRGARRAAALATSALALAILGSAFLFASVWLAVAGALVAVCGLPFAFSSRRLGLCRLASAAVVGAMVLAIPDTPLRDIQVHSDRLAKKLNGVGGEKLGFHEKLSVYAVGWGRTVVAKSRGRHSQARELFYLFFPGADRRSWRSDRAIGAAAPTLARFVASLDGHARRRDRASMRPAQIGGLAYESFVLNAQAVRAAKGWRLETTAVLPIRYARGTRIPIASVRNMRLAIDSSLFWMLQQSGWLFPYTAEYRWSLDPDDRRLRRAHASRLASEVHHHD